LFSTPNTLLSTPDTLLSTPQLSVLKLFVFFVFTKDSEDKTEVADIPADQQTGADESKPAEESSAAEESAQGKTTLLCSMLSLWYFIGFLAYKYFFRKLICCNCRSALIISLVLICMLNVDWLAVSYYL